MARVNVELEEQLSDARSNEVAYRVKVENIGASAVSLVSINPQIPDDVELLEVKDSSAQASKTRHEKLCKELTELLRDHVFLTSKEVQDRILAIQKRMFKELLSDAATIWRLYYSLLTGQYFRRLERQREARAAVWFRIESTADAAIALRNWFDVPGEGPSLEILFRAKCEQLELLEREMSTDSSGSAIAVIEPDSFFATTYVLRFPRSSVDARKFSFSVEAGIADAEAEAEADAAKVQLHAASVSVTVSPKPYILSLITVVAALLGAVVKFVVENRADGGLYSFFGNLGVSLVTAPGISGMVLAFVIFNIYEFLELGDRIRVGVGWRSALLVGVLCGLFSDRMIAALQALIGG